MTQMLPIQINDLIVGTESDVCVTSFHQRLCHRILNSEDIQTVR